MDTTSGAAVQGQEVEGAGPEVGECVVEVML